MTQRGRIQEPLDEKMSAEPAAAWREEWRLHILPCEHLPPTRRSSITVDVQAPIPLGRGILAMAREESHRARCYSGDTEPLPRADRITVPLCPPVRLGAEVLPMTRLREEGEGEEKR